MNNTPLSISASLKRDKEYFENAEKLQEGALLTDLSNSSGKVFFSLQEIPIRTKFITVNKNILQRVNEELIKIFNEQDNLHVHNIKITRSITDSNKDILIWAQFQSDLSIVDDERNINVNGIHLRDIYTGLAIRVHSLKDLKIGTKYFTENDNLLIRTNQNEVLLGDKIIYIHKPRPVDSNAVLEAQTILYDTPGGIAEAKEEVQQVASLLWESDNFPKLTKCVIEGKAIHTSPIQCVSSYIGGVEGNSIIRWERCKGSETSFTAIKMETSLTYQPTMIDINARIRVSYLPVRADGVVGLICYSNVITIRIDPEIQHEVASNVSLGGFVAKVLELQGNEFQKRSIYLNEEKIKVRKKRNSIAKSTFGPSLHIYPDKVRECCFTIELPNGQKLDFMAPSSFQRDVIVLTVLEYNKRYSSNLHHHGVEKKTSFD